METNLDFSAPSGSSFSEMDADAAAAMEVIARRLAISVLRQVLDEMFTEKSLFACSLRLGRIHLAGDDFVWKILEIEAEVEGSDPEGGGRVGEGIVRAPKEYSNRLAPFTKSLSAALAASERHGFRSDLVEFPTCSPLIVDRRSLADDGFWSAVVAGSVSAFSRSRLERSCVDASCESNAMQGSGLSL